MEIVTYFVTKTLKYAVKGINQEVVNKNLTAVCKDLEIENIEQ